MSFSHDGPDGGVTLPEQSRCKDLTPILCGIGCVLFPVLDDSRRQD